MGEDNGYVDASNFVQCQQIAEQDDGTAYYAGAMCANSGAKIKIGVFSDEDCSQPESSLSVEDYVGAKLSTSLMRNIYSGSGVSCIKPNWEVEEENDEEDENVHGFAESIVNYDNYENQAAQEDLVCQFIKTMKRGAYDETGEIILQARVTAVEGATAATGGQKFGLTVFILGTVGLAMYASTLHSQITKGGSSGLATKGGAMA